MFPPKVRDRRLCAPPDSDQAVAFTGPARQAGPTTIVGPACRAGLLVLNEEDAIGRNKGPARQAGPTRQTAFFGQAGSLSYEVANGGAWPVGQLATLVGREPAGSQTLVFTAKKRKT